MSKITMKMDEGDAVLLFELLSKINEMNPSETFKIDSIYSQVLHNVEHDLGSVLTEPYLHNYLDLIETYRSQTAEKSGLKKGMTVLELRNCSELR